MSDYTDPLIHDILRLESSITYPAELESRVIRAQQWPQIFASNTDAQLALEELKSNISKIAGTSATRMRNGDIRIITQGMIEDVITPSIGNIDHPYTLDDLQIPTMNELLLAVGPAKFMAMSNPYGLDVFISVMQGVPATKKWETIMLGNKVLPQRIGYYLYPDNALKQRTVLVNYFPLLFTASTAYEL